MDPAFTFSTLYHFAIPVIIRIATMTNRTKISWKRKWCFSFDGFIGLWCWTPHSTIFQLYHGGGNPKYLTNFIIYSCIEYTSPWTGFKLTTLMVICTDCTGSCKSNYHMIPTTTVPFSIEVFINKDHCLVISVMFCYTNDN